MEYRSTGKQLTGQLLLVVPFKTGQYDSIRVGADNAKHFGWVRLFWNGSAKL
jgi:hypothetical protein